MSDIYIAIGMHKTGSSWLQIEIFPHLKGIKHIHLIGSIVEQFHEDWKYNKILISSEGLSGGIWDNKYVKRNKYKNFEFRTNTWIEKYYNSVDNLKKLFPDAKIILMFRKHFELIKSVYKQYLHEGGFRKFDRFFDITNNEGLIKKEEFLFRNRVDYLIKNFDRKNLFISSFEKMNDNTISFLEELNSFIGIQEYNDGFELAKRKKKIVNPGVRRIQSEMLRISNKIDYYLSLSKILPTLNNKIFRILNITPRKLFQYRLRNIDRRDIRINEITKSKINNFYEEDWEYVNEFIG